jgi:bacillithiol biosynthesis cysteine-adding enzyme BshC
MDCIATRIPYRQANAFNKIVLDYIDQAAALKSFFVHAPSLQGIQKAIDARKQYPTDRATLVQELKKQYEGVEASDKVKNNIELLLSADTFTITTAHQNNLFTGPLYFIYKIIHAIKLAEHLRAAIPGRQFVPVFYMGTEDADLEELNHIYLQGEKLVWETNQTGAVGRMKIDKALLKLVDRIEGQLTVLPNGAEIISLLRKCYKDSATVQDATFHFVDHLFAGYGLVVLLPDNAALKKQMTTVFEDDLLHQTASGIVENTAAQLQEFGYKVQANPREINLFYLRDDKRERIIKTGIRYKAKDMGLDLTVDEIRQELKKYPQRFSPNVILRGIYQETILPNIVFIGGGGELAYWLQLKALFENYKVPFPVLALRNSFLFVEKKWQDKISRLGFSAEDFFLPEQELLNKLVTRESKHALGFNGSIREVEQLYEAFRKQATAIDSSLDKHVKALKEKTVYRLQELEKKMLRAEKRKYTDQRRQIQLIYEQLSPGGGLQERRENLLYYYAKWGDGFIQQLHHFSLGLEQEFVVMKEH